MDKHESGYREGRWGTHSKSHDVDYKIGYRRGTASRDEEPAAVNQSAGASSNEARFWEGTWPFGYMLVAFVVSIAVAGLSSYVPFAKNETQRIFELSMVIGFFSLAAMIINEQVHEKRFDIGGLLVLIGVGAFLWWVNDTSLLFTEPWKW